MRTVIVTRMTVEWDVNADSEDGMVAAEMSAPCAFATMDEAKADIEEAVRMEYLEEGRYVIMDIARRPHDGGWSVTVWYNGGRTEFRATEIKLKQDEYMP